LTPSGSVVNGFHDPLLHVAADPVCVYIHHVIIQHVVFVCENDMM